MPLVGPIAAEERPVPGGTATPLIVGLHERHDGQAYDARDKACGNPTEVISHV